MVANDSGHNSGVFNKFLGDNTRGLLSETKKRMNCNNAGKRKVVQRKSKEMGSKINKKDSSSRYLPTS